MVEIGNPYPKIVAEHVYEVSMMAQGDSREEFVKRNLHWLNDAIPKFIDGLDRTCQTFALGVMPEIAHARSKGMSLWSVYVPLLGIIPMEAREGQAPTCSATVTLNRFVMAASSDIHPRIAERGITAEVRHLLLANIRFSQAAPLFCYGPFTDYRKLK